MIPYKSREIPGGFYYQLKNLSKKLKNSLDRAAGLLKMA